MIAFLKGTLEDIGTDHCIIGVNDVGYKVYLPAPDQGWLGKIGEEVKLYTHLIVKEDALELYGFRTAEEVELFKTLLSVSGIGPRVGLKILSSVSIDKFKNAVWEGNLSILTAIPGIGKKTAQRLVLELREKFGALPFAGRGGAGQVIEGGGVEGDAYAALLALGYTQSEVSEAISYARRELGDELGKFDTSGLVQYLLKTFLAR